MSESLNLQKENEEYPTVPRQVALDLSPAEADALLSILLHTPRLPDVTEEMTERLAYRIANLQRELVRNTNGSSLSSRNGIEKSRRVVKNRERRVPRVEVTV